MESSYDLRARARRGLEVAEQMLVHTYPVVKDPKLILAVAGDICAALTSSMEAFILEKGGDLEADFGSNLATFTRLAKDYSFDADELELIGRLHDVIEAHKKSPVEFPRKDRFIICDEKYDCREITLEDMKNYLFRARLFIEKSEASLEKTK